MSNTVNTNNIKRLAILWFRNDLRVHDNLTLHKCIDLVAKKQIDLVVPFYCFDRDILEGVSRETRLARCSPFRRNFMIESVRDLAVNLHTRLGSRLLVAYGQPELELASLVDKLTTSSSSTNNELLLTVAHVLASREVAHEEIELEKKCEKLMKDRKVKFELIWDNTMIHLDDLPYEGGNIQDMPDTFTSFRKTVESRNGEYDVRKPVTIPSGFKFPALDPSHSSVFAELERANWGEANLPARVETRALVPANKSAIDSMRGGETAANERMLNYFFKTDGLNVYKTTRNGMIGTEYSSKFSMWLALGCMSARVLYWKVKEFESARRANESTKHFVFELLWRDFFKFHGLKFGRKIFYLNGLWSSRRQASGGGPSRGGASGGGRASSGRGHGGGGGGYRWKTDVGLFEKWCKGETGYPYVDANMRELNETGWMSNRGRQNVASFLTKDMEIDWRWGAEYFESMLVDHDPTSNWCNWQYVAGVGVDPRDDRYFNTTKQAYDYDEQGEYARLWLPVLAKMPRELIYCPWRASPVEQKRYECVLGKDYPAPCVRAKFDWNPSQQRRPNKFAEKSKRNF